MAGYNAAMIFHQNLDHLFQTMHQAGSAQDFFKNHWLYADGTFSTKTWFTRIVYWIRDLGYDKTNRDIYAVYKRCVTEYIESVYNFRSLRSDDPSMLEGVKTLGKRVLIIRGGLTAIPWGKHDECLALAQSFLASLNFLKLEQFEKEETEVFPSKLNLEALKVSPPELELKLPIAQDDPIHKMEDLLGQFDALIPVEGRSEADIASRKYLEERLIEAVKRKDVKFLGMTSMDQPPAAFFEQLHHVLKNIAFELKQDNVTVDRKREVLRRLGACSKDCPTRWIEEAFQQYGALTSQGLNVRARVLKLVQNLKENLLYTDIQEKLQQIIPNSWIGRLFHRTPQLLEPLHGLGIHLLNKFRAGPEGTQLGLDQQRAELDHNRNRTCWFGSFFIGGWNPVFTPTYAQNVMQKHLKREYIVEQVRSQMLEEMEKWPIRYQEVHSFLLNTAKSIHVHNHQGLPGAATAEDYIANQYYDDTKYINAKGVNRILRECGIN